MYPNLMENLYPEKAVVYSGRYPLLHRPLCPWLFYGEFDVDQQHEEELCKWDTTDVAVANEVHKDYGQPERYECVLLRRSHPQNGTKH